MKHNAKDACVHCHLCQKNCAFLQKHKIDIGDIEQLKELAYHCFLCGKCAEVCPKGINGREVILEMRRENPAKKGYGMLIGEKKDYVFKNYRHGKKKSVLFPGCNFPSFYPKTTQQLVNLLQEKADVGVVYDCCGKPISELGMKKEEEAIITRIQSNLEELGVEEVIMLCPNCYTYLKPRLHVKVVSIYEKLDELGLGNPIEKDIKVHLPCPERSGKHLLKQMESFLTGSVEILQDAQCCGLGGCGGRKEPGLAKMMASSMKEKEIYTYCASCASSFTRNRCKQVSHILVDILGSDEKPDTGKSVLNRMKTKIL